MELLDDKYVPFTKYSTDIRNAISQLHNLGVVYIDIKADNVGFSTFDQTYKLFDFDCSGIIHPQDPKRWQNRPFEGYRYREVKVHETSIQSLCYDENENVMKKNELDFISWDLTCRNAW
jgi:hypothetical protein